MAGWFDQYLGGEQQQLMPGQGYAGQQYSPPLGGPPGVDWNQPNPLRDQYQSAVGGAPGGGGMTLDMFKNAMSAAGLDPVAVQGHGQQIADAINQMYPQAGVTVDPQSDAIMYQGHPFDVTIDSGKGGWSWRQSDVPEGGGDYGQGYGGMVAPWTQQFHAPTAEEALQSPGLQFAMQQGLGAIQKSAAARGTLLTGGTLKGLNDWAQGTALQAYGDVYNRALGEYGLARENFYANQDRPFAKYQSLAALGQGAGGSLNTSASGYGSNAADLLTGIGNATAAGRQGSGMAWGGALNTLGNLAQQWSTFNRPGSSYPGYPRYGGVTPSYYPQY